MNGPRKAKSDQNRSPRSSKRVKRKNRSTNIQPIDEAFRLRYIETYLHCLIDDAFLLCKGAYSLLDSSRDKARISARLDKEGLGFATNTLPAMCNEFLKFVETGQASFPQFKKKRGMLLPALFGGLMLEAVSESTTSAVAFDSLYTILVAFKKLRGPYAKKTLKSQWLDFCATDKSLGDIDWFEPTRYFILNHVRQSFREYFRKLDHEDLDQSWRFTPRPGPGATNTPTEKTMRYEPHCLYKQIDEVLPYQVWFYPTPWHACLSARDYLLLYNSAESNPSSRFKFVPKYAGKARGICIEQNEMQVLQQAFRYALESVIEDSYTLSKCLPLSDQSVNASIALASSTSLEFATIDMSDGSDRVAREMVAWCTQDIPIHEPLMALSTRTIIMDPVLYGSLVKPKKKKGKKKLKCDHGSNDKDVSKLPNTINALKYAPMGSGLCFPVMSLMHLLLIRGILYYAFPAKADLWKEVRVYGDDIIVPSEFFDTVCDMLPLFGMKINRTKSYCRSHFRESCGIHAYKGRDVTPVYLKYIPQHQCREGLPSLLENEMSLTKKGFYRSAQFLRDSIVAEYRIDYSIPSLPMQNLSLFRRPDLPVSQVVAVQKRRLKSRWNDDLQSSEFLLPRLTKNVFQRRITCDQHAYLRRQWRPGRVDFTITSVKNDDEEAHLRFGRWTIGDSFGDIKISKGWVPESALFSSSVQ